MKRLLAATSVCALVLAGAALAQTSTGTGRDTQGMSQGGMSNTGPGGSVSSQGSMQNRGSMSNQSSGSMSSQGSMSDQGMSSGSSRSASHGGQGSSQDIMQAQTELKQMGLYNGQVDGKMGKQTKQAISKFQKQNGLRQTAQLDRQTKDRLMHGGAGGATSGSTSTSTQGSSMHNSSGSGSMGGSSTTGGTSR